jgi:hypothetical protein
MQPTKVSQVEELKKLGINEIIIYKNDVNGDTTKEKKLLEAQGFDPKNIHHFPMRWKEVDHLDAFDQTMEPTGLSVNEDSFAVSAAADSHQLSVDIGLALMLTQGVSGFINYHQLARNLFYAVQSLQAGMRWEF